MLEMLYCCTTVAAGQGSNQSGPESRPETYESLHWRLIRSSAWDPKNIQDIGIFPVFHSAVSYLSRASSSYIQFKVLTLVCTTVAEI
jgi:hypothetical protein